MQRPMTSGRARTPVDPADLRQELTLVRERGFAVNLGQNQPNVSAVGASIFDEHDYPIGAITISAPSDRLDAALSLELGPVVADAARRITMGMRIGRARS